MNNPRWSRLIPWHYKPLSLVGIWALTFCILVGLGMVLWIPVAFLLPLIGQSLNLGPLASMAWTMGVFILLVTPWFLLGLIVRFGIWVFRR